MSSKQPGKQRKAQFNAPLHVKRKRIRARLRTDDPNPSSHQDSYCQGR